MEWNNKQPIYLQLKEKIATQILDKKIQEGAMLPSIRQISLDYQINPLTASKAYQSLVDDGILEKKRGLGMQVMQGAYQTLHKKQRQLFLKDEWPEIQQKLKRLNIDIGELLDE